jgi:hypothetical protein
MNLMLAFVPGSAKNEFLLIDVTDEPEELGVSYTKEIKTRFLTFPNVNSSFEFWVIRLEISTFELKDFCHAFSLGSLKVSVHSMPFEIILGRALTVLR